MSITSFVSYRSVSFFFLLSCIHQLNFVNFSRGEFLSSSHVGDVSNYVAYTSHPFFFSFFFVRIRKCVEVKYSLEEEESSSSKSLPICLSGSLLSFSVMRNHIDSDIYRHILSSFYCKQHIALLIYPIVYFFEIKLDSSRALLLSIGFAK